MWQRWHTAVLDVGKIWVFGGNCSKDGSLKNDVWYFDTVGWEWNSVESIGLRPSPRFSHISDIQFGKMWVFGGVVSTGLSSELWCFDTSASNWTLVDSGSGPSARESMAMVISGGKLWVFAGYDGRKRNDLWSFDTSRGTWTLVDEGSGPSERWSPATVQHAERMWVLGGWSQAGLEKDVWYFDTRALTWTTVDAGAGMSPRESHTAVLRGSKIWVFGGLTTTGEAGEANDADAVWCLDTEAASWTLADSGTGPRNFLYPVSVMDEAGRMWSYYGTFWYFDTLGTSTITASSTTRTKTSTQASTTNTTLTSTTTSTSTSTAFATRISSSSTTTQSTWTTSTTSSISSSSSSASKSSSSSTSAFSATQTSQASFTTMSTSSSSTSSWSSSSSTSTFSATQTQATGTSSTMSTSASCWSSSSTTTSITRTATSTLTQTETTSTITETTSTSNMGFAFLAGRLSSENASQLEDLLMSHIDSLLTANGNRNPNSTNVSQTSEVQLPDGAVLSLTIPHETQPVLATTANSTVFVPRSVASLAARPALAALSVPSGEHLGDDLRRGAVIDMGGKEKWRLAGPLLELSLLDLDSNSKVDVKNLSEPIIFRIASGSFSGAKCAFLTPTPTWSQEGVYRPSPEELRAIGDDTSGFWCATTHLTTFSILEPVVCSFWGSLKPGAVCFDPPIFSACLLGVAFCLCCSVWAFCLLMKSRKVIGGTISLQDTRGSEHEVPFQVVRPRLQGMRAGCKTTVSWSLEAEKWQARNPCSFSRDSCDLGSLASPTRFADRGTRVRTKQSFFRSNSVLSSTGSSAGYHHPSPSEAEGLETEGFEGVVPLPLPTIASPVARKEASPCGPLEAYVDGTKVEYFSETHNKWVQGSIQGPGRVGRNGMPVYTVALGRGRPRSFVPLERLRLPFEKAEAVSVEFQGRWQAAVVVGMHSLPLAYAVRLPDETLVFPAEKVRVRYVDGDAVDVYQGLEQGWVTAVCGSGSESSWPEVSVKSSDGLLRHSISYVRRSEFAEV
ncbi:unnamed protein product [Effrenium voratum]|nr:unnamed protein product [Effrenium voratum]